MSLTVPRFPSTYKPLFQHNDSKHTHKPHSNLDQAKASGNTSYGVAFDNNISFSLEIFSIYESEPTLSKSYPSGVISTNQDGAKTVDTNTTY